MSQFRCPVCNSNRYGRLEKRLPNGTPYLSVLYRCLNCNFGFTDFEQFVKSGPDSDRERFGKPAENR